MFCCHVHTVMNFFNDIKTAYLNYFHTNTPTCTHNIYCLLCTNSFNCFCTSNCYFLTFLNLENTALESLDLNLDSGKSSITATYIVAHVRRLLHVRVRTWQLLRKYYSLIALSRLLLPTLGSPRMATFTPDLNLSPRRLSFKCFMTS